MLSLTMFIWESVSRRIFDKHDDQLDCSKRKKKERKKERNKERKIRITNLDIGNYEN